MNFNKYRYVLDLVHLAEVNVTVTNHGHRRSQCFLVVLSDTCSFSLAISRLQLSFVFNQGRLTFFQAKMGLMLEK